MISEKAWKYLNFKKKRNESFAKLLDRLLKLEILEKEVNVK